MVSTRYSKEHMFVGVWYIFAAFGRNLAFDVGFVSAAATVATKLKTSNAFQRLPPVDRGIASGRGPSRLVHVGVAGQLQRNAFSLACGQLALVSVQGK